MKKCDFTKLLNNSLESYYWIGFILADGHVHNSVRLSITLSKKDKEHLIKLQKFLNIETLKESSQISISGMDSNIIRKFCKKFDIKSNKTENPPDLKVFENLNDFELESLFCGFVDGDGNIHNLHNRKDFHLRIKCHKSWENILKYFSHKLLNDCTVKINNQGYASLICSNTKILKKFKLKILNYELPILKRKWDKIDLNYVSKQEKGQNNIVLVKNMLLNKNKKVEIAKELNLSKSAISQIIKRNNL